MRAAMVHACYAGALGFKPIGDMLPAIFLSLVPASLDFFPAQPEIVFASQSVRVIVDDGTDHRKTCGAGILSVSERNDSRRAVAAVPRNIGAVRPGAKHPCPERFAQRPNIIVTGHATAPNSGRSTSFAAHGGVIPSTWIM